MSIGSPTVDRTTTELSTSPLSDAFFEIPIFLKPSVQDSVATPWKQINDVVEKTLGISEPWDLFVEESDSGGNLPTEVLQTYEVVADGIRVSSTEFRSRFGGVDLDALRCRMSSAKFKAYVRFMGIIPGGPELDVAKISEIPR